MNANQTHTLPAVALLLDACRGIYIPRAFVEYFDTEQWGLDTESWAFETCCQPDSDGYWDAWTEILDTAKFEEDGYTWTLYQDGDLWALCPELMTSEELENFGFDHEMVEERRCQERAE